MVRYSYEDLGYAVLLKESLSDSCYIDTLLQGDDASIFLNEIDDISEDFIQYYISQYF